MNRRFFTSLLLVTAACIPVYGFAAEDIGKSVEDTMHKAVVLGPGVQRIEKDKKGRIVSCLVVGQAIIRTSLGKATGIETARDKANLAASVEFVKWLKEDVTVLQSSDGESVTLLEGTEGTDDESAKESGKRVEKDTKKMETTAKALVRGLQLLHKEVDAKGKTYTVVKGWKADTSAATKKIAADLADDDSGHRKNSQPIKASGKSGKIDKDIESDSVTSDDAKEFLK